MYRYYLTLFFVFGGLSIFVAQADQPYVELPRSAWSAQDQNVEVMEFFSYGCRFCYDLEPTINHWIELLPPDVHFSRVPAMVGGIWDVYGQLYLTLETMGVRHEVHTAVFESVRVRQAMVTPEDMAHFLAGQGIEPKAFLATFHSFAVQAKVKEARRKTAVFEVVGVPSLVVNGRYRFDQTAGGASGMLKLAEILIDKERISQ